jgi:3-oxoacyl-[acyl-carrier protein] reductase
MKLELEGKKAIVCGATQGIGKAIALKFANMGATVTIVARNSEKLEATRAELATPVDQKHTIISLDFSDFQAVKEYLSTWNDETDILVNNTGGPKGGPIIEADISEFISTFNQHLICNHLFVQAVVPSMKKRGGGRIINIISTSVKQPLVGLGVSNTIRGAVGSWSKSLANELGQFNITVNNVLPGATNTIRLQQIAEVKSEKTGHSVPSIFEEMALESPMKRIAEPEEIANAVAFLASPAASYINGINVPVDGGRTKSL